jgi:protein gp37
MGEITNISWTDHTFNPWIGCTKVSPACDGCYAEAMMDLRYGRVKWGGERVRTAPSNWKKPVKWNREAEKNGTRPRVFCASLADVFDNQVPPEWREDLFDLIRITPNLRWLLLTKRPQNIVKMVHTSGAIAGNGTRYLPGNAALGTTIEDQQRADINVPPLLDAKTQCGPAFVFVSCEPLLGDINLRCVAPTDTGYINALSSSTGPNIDFVIAGGETDQGAHKARPSQPGWFRSLRDQCAEAGVSFHFKQWGEWLAGEANYGQFDAAPMNAYRRCDNHSYEWPDTRRVQNFGTHLDVWSGALTTRRIGKKAAGRLLDGIEHNVMPG